MSIVTISRGAFSHGRELAEKLARKLGYESLSREVLFEASAHFNIPEIKLLHAIQDAPSIIDRLTYGKEHYVAFVREALLHHLRRDKVVYHGWAGHFFVTGVSHVLKVRILADLEDRMAEVQRREDLPADEARKRLQDNDEALHRWSLFLYGIDPADPSLYDLVIHLKVLNPDDAVEIISETLKRPCYLTTPESQQAMETLFLAAQVQAALVDDMPSAQVEVEGGEILVTVGGSFAEEKKLTAKVDRVVDNLRGVKVKVRLISS